MTTAFAIKVIIMVLAVLFVSFGLLHEDKFVAFEDAIIRFIKKKIYLRKRRKAAEKRRMKQNRYVACTGGMQYEARARRQGSSIERRRVA